MGVQSADAQSQGQFSVVPAVLVALVGLIIFGSGLYGLSTASREAEAIGPIDWNLEYGPVLPTGSIEQSLGDMPDPVRRITAWVVEPRVGSRLNGRLLRRTDTETALLFEESFEIDANGRVDVQIPAHIAASGSGLVIQFVNPTGSPGSISMRGNRSDAYANGRSSIDGDAGDGSTDLVFQLRRIVTPRSIAAAAIGASVMSIVFFAASATMLVIAAGLFLRRLSERIRGGRPMASAIALVVAGALSWTALGIFQIFEPWRH